MKTKKELKYLEQKYKNWREIYYADGPDIYPKPVESPKIHFIQYPEPHVIISDWYEEPQNWYSMYTIIQDLAEQAYICYERGLFHASIASSISCCEYILKYEYLRKIDRKQSTNLLVSGRFTLGKLFVEEKNPLKILKLSKLYKKIVFLNNIRNGFFHYLPDRLDKARKQGKSFLDRELDPITDEIAVPRTAFRVYSIMEELINFFYNEKMRIKYIKEGLEDSRRRSAERRNATKK